MASWRYGQQTGVVPDPTSVSDYTDLRVPCLCSFAQLPSLIARLRSAGRGTRPAITAIRAAVGGRVTRRDEAQRSRRAAE